MSDGSFKVYDSNQISLVCFGFPIDSGYADGDFVTIEEAADTFTEVVGADGEVTRSKTNSRLATVTVTLMQSSDGNAKFSAQALLDRKGKNGAGVGGFLLKDRQGTSLYTASKCWISKPPSVAFGKAAGPRVWTLKVADLQRLDGGN